MKKGVGLGLVLGVLIIGALWVWQRSSMQFEEGSHLLRVSPAKTFLEGDPDDFVTVVFTLRNLSDHERLCQLGAELPSGWTLLEELPSVTIGPQAQQELFLTVQIPPETPPGRYLISLRAQSDSDVALGRAQIVVRARERLKLLLTTADLAVHFDEEKALLLTVANRGNVSARVTVTVTAAPVGWRFQLRESSVSVAPGESKVVELRVRPLSSAELAPGRFTVQAASPSARDELSFTVVLMP